MNDILIQTMLVSINKAFAFTNKSNQPENNRPLLDDIGFLNTIIVSQVID